MEFASEFCRSLCQFLYIFRYTVEVCPYGDESRLPEDREIFDLTSTEGNPDDALRGSDEKFPVDRSEKIIIRVNDTPKKFTIMDLTFRSDVPVKVRIIKEDEPPINNVVNIIANADFSH